MQRPLLSLDHRQFIFGTEEIEEFSSWQNLLFHIEQWWKPYFI